MRGAYGYNKARLDDFGTTGLSLLNPISSGTADQFLVPTFQDSTAWVGFTTSYFLGGGANAVDNFQITPEPTTLQLFSFGTALLLAPIFVRRRQGRN